MAEKAPATQEVATTNFSDANEFIDNIDPRANPNVTVINRDQLSNLGDSPNAPRDLERGFSYDTKEASVKGGIYGEEIAKIKTQNDGYYPKMKDAGSEQGDYERDAEMTHSEVVANDGDSYVSRSGEEVTQGTGTTVKYEADTSSHSGENEAKVMRSGLDQSGNRIEYFHKFKSPKAAKLITRLAMKTIRRGEPSVSSSSEEERKSA